MPPRGRDRAGGGQKPGVSGAAGGRVPKAGAGRARRGDPRREREELAVINDQFGAPTGAELLADCTAHAIRVALNKPDVAGLYHLVASGTTTWYDYAALVFEEARKAGIPLALNKLNAVATTAYPTPARRPHNSRLNTEKFQQNFALVLPDWQVGVKRMLNELFTTTAI